VYSIPETTNLMDMIGLMLFELTTRKDAENLYIAAFLRHSVEMSCENPDAHLEVRRELRKKKELLSGDEITLRTPPVG